MGQHHQAGSAGELLLKCSKHFAIGAGLLITSAPELLHRQHVNLKLKAASQFMACGHNARVFTVADQDVVAAVQRKAPEPPQFYRYARQSYPNQCSIR